LEKPFHRAQLFEAVLVGGLPTSVLMRVDLKLDAMKLHYIKRVIEAHGGSKSAAARSLGMQRTTLQRMLKRKR